MDWLTLSPYPIKINRSERAKRLSLRIAKDRDCFILTLPKHFSLSAAEKFVRDNSGWLIKASFHLQTPQKLTDTTKITFLGEKLEIVSVPDAKLGVYKEKGRLYVSGGEEFLPRRVKEYFFSELASYIKARVGEYAKIYPYALTKRIGGKVGTVAIRDVGTRWGSCSSSGTLSFNFRLGFAPLNIIDYVIAHELAHLTQMNHSDKFWKVVESLYPNWQDARKWLKINGAKLHAWNF